MGHIVFVDVGHVIGVDTFVVAWTLIGSLGLDRVGGVTGHRHCMSSKSAAGLVPPGCQSAQECPVCAPPNPSSAPKAVRDRTARRPEPRPASGRRPDDRRAELKTLLAEADEALREFEELIGRINRTNAATAMEVDGTLTDALARRDVLRLRHHVLTTAADAAAGTNQHSYARQLRSELKMFSALPVGDLRARADQVARELRELDVRIQRTNWEVDLQN